MADMDFSFSLFATLLLATFTFHLANANGNASVPAFFIFGDSSADVGTNTYLPGSLARADFPFNGIDFPFSRPTGRFSNGLNTADFVAKLMGFKRSPVPFLFLQCNTSRFQKRISRGVNFASGGCGLLDRTGLQVKVVTMSEQIQQFIIVRDTFTAAIGLGATKTMLSKSIFAISVGSNDLFAFFGSNSTMPKEQFLTILLNQYEGYIKALYNLGARKYGIISIAPIGCCPSQRFFNATGGCLEGLNDFARAFHSSLAALLYRLSSELKEMKYSLANTYEMTINIIQNPAPYGFENVEAACCGTGRLNAETQCDATAYLCTNRKNYLFWDRFHPTQAACQLAAVTLYDGPTRFVTPINFRQLAEDY